MGKPMSRTAALREAQKWFGVVHAVARPCGQREAVYGFTYPDSHGSGLRRVAECGSYKTALASRGYCVAAYAARLLGASQDSIDAAWDATDGPARDVLRWIMES